jgi:ABC-type lipoprotein release transport system permease subunit
LLIKNCTVEIKKATIKGNFNIELKSSLCRGLTPKILSWLPFNKGVKSMGIINRAFRNLSRRKVRALLVIIALGFAMAIMISIPAGALANQQSANEVANRLSNTITQTSASINQTLTQIECNLAAEFSGFGFRPPELNSTSFGGFGQAPPSGASTPRFDPSQFGGGDLPGQFGGGSFGGGRASPMNQSLYSDINNTIKGVAAVEPILQASEGTNATSSFMGRTFTRQITEYTIEGIPLTSDLIDNYPILNTNITAGRNLQAGDTNVVLLSENNSAYFSKTVGDTVTILGKEFTVVGIHGTNSVTDRLVLYMNLSDAQAVTNNTGYITSLRVFTTNSEQVSAVANTISSMHSELTVSTPQERMTQLQQLQSSYSTALENAQNSMSATQTTAFEEIVIVIVATSLIVLFVMLYTVRERTKEIGTLKAIGFSDRTVMGQFIVEGIMLSVTAGIVGIAIGIVAAPVISSLLLPSVSNNIFGGGGSFAVAAQTTATASINLELVLIAFGASIALGVIGSLYPSWRAAKIRPAEAMKYE